MSAAPATNHRALSEADVLALTLWGEAAGRPVRAIEGVAAVAVNRLRLAKGEAAAGPVRGIAALCRAPFGFPCWNPRHPRHAGMLEGAAERDGAFAACRRIAARAAAGLLPDPTGGATHYHAAETLPRWAVGRVPSAELGGLVFYRLAGG
jgi:N-acetylmuramoyl-L-alanine amidase